LKDLLIIFIISVLLAPLVLFTSGAPRIVLGLAFVLFFPGYTLIAALFPRRTSLSGVERPILSFGLSIAVVPLIGLVLNYTWEIRLNSILISVLLFIVIMAALAWYRRRRLSPEVRFEPQFRIYLSSLRSYWVSHGLLDRIITTVLVLAIAGTIGTLAFVVVAPKIGEKYTEFYILGRDSQADGYPAKFVMADNEVIFVTYATNDEDQDVSDTLGRVTLSIVNREREESTYHVSVRIDGEQVDFHLRGNMVNDTGLITLDHEEKWENDIGFAPEHVGASQKVEFVLYKGGEAYFDDPIHLWIDVVN